MLSTIDKLELGRDEQEAGTGVERCGHGHVTSVAGVLGEGEGDDGAEVVGGVRRRRHGRRRRPRLGGHGGRGGGAGASGQAQAGAGARVAAARRGGGEVLADGRGGGGSRGRHPRPAAGWGLGELGRVPAPAAVGSRLFSVRPRRAVRCGFALNQTTHRWRSPPEPESARASVGLGLTLFAPSLGQRAVVVTTCVLSSFQKLVASTSCNSFSFSAGELLVNN